MAGRIHGYDHLVTGSSTTARVVLDDLAARGTTGGSVDDALVGAAAAMHRVALATRDRRALETYRMLDVDVRIVGSLIPRRP